MPCKHDHRQHRTAAPAAAAAAAAAQAPALRTEYWRTAWQRYDSNSVRLSLDEHMLLLRQGSAAAGSGDWCADLESAAVLPPCGAVRFPYAILEVKLQEDAPPWVGALAASGVLVEAPRFSKFLHGMALLHSGRCATSPCWFGWDEAARCTTPASLEEMRAANAQRCLLKQQQVRGRPRGAVRCMQLLTLQLPLLLAVTRPRLCQATHG